MNAELSHAPPDRTLFTTLVGIAAILLGGLGSVFSAFALLMAIGKPYANSNADVAGIFFIFILPPGTLLAGIGLLFRFRWARWCVILLMTGLVALGVKGLFPSTTTYTSIRTTPEGSSVQTTRIEHRPDHVLSAGCIAVGGLVLLGMLSGPVRREFRGKGKALPPPRQDESEGWRVGHTGRDMMFYEEKLGGRWERLEISGEMLTGAAHHVIYFRGAEGWEAYPDWARGRREEIIARIKNRFHAPEYEYQEDGRPASAYAGAPVAAEPVVARAPMKKDGSILMPVAALLLIAAGAFWLVHDGIKEGEVGSIAKYQRSRMFSREADTALFWTTISVLGVVGAGCTGFAGWIVVASARSGK
jgi:hypothetical protein